jgi:hypothetical protein
MKNEDFNTMVEETLNKCKTILGEKKKVYATEDRFHNFKERQKMLRVHSPIDVAFNDFTKHFQAYKDKIEMYGGLRIFTLDQFDENIIDMINYLLLMRGMIIEIKERG